MTPLQKLTLRASEVRTRLAAIGGMSDLTDEVRSELETCSRMSMPISKAVPASVD